jgi:hypothetical protein
LCRLEVPVQITSVREGANVGEFDHYNFLRLFIERSFKASVNDFLLPIELLFLL